MNPGGRVAASGSFLVEEFINSITVQLDKVQDASAAEVGEPAPDVRA